jgi:glycosyltransferase involved in cell wall biosynthesis
MRLALILKGYPRLSETFIAQEILGLERAGLDFLIISLRHPTDPVRHPIHREIKAEVMNLPEYLHEEPARVWLGLQQALASGSIWRVLHNFIRDLVRDRSRNRMRRLGQALVLARELPADISCLYVHYLHTPTSVARYTASLRRLPFAISAHAKDIWTIPDWEIREKLHDAEWLTTCTRLGHRHLHALAPEAKIFCQVHGLDLDRLPMPSRDRRSAGSQPDRRPFELLTVARAVEKKGLDVLVKSLAALSSDIDWRWRHIGTGPLLPQLRTLAIELGVDHRIEWMGARSFDAVIDALGRADLFCFSPRVARDGDRDGIPNVVAEAMSQGLPVVAARAGAVDELVEDGRTGLLVPPDNPDAFARAMEALIRDPVRRARMGHAARKVIEERFAAKPGIERLAKALKSLASIRKLAR